MYDGVIGCPPISDNPGRDSKDSKRYLVRDSKESVAREIGLIGRGFYHYVFAC